MIVLSFHEKEIIKAIKKDVKICSTDWYDQLCPLFSTIFEFKFVNGRGTDIMFNHLFLIYMKIYGDDNHMATNQLSLLHISFSPKHMDDPDDPIERCINKVCELILANRVSGRYSLN